MGVKSEDSRAQRASQVESDPATLPLSVTESQTTNYHESQSPLL